MAEQLGNWSSAAGGENANALGQWTSHGPYGGTVLSLAVDPISTNVLYAGTPAGVFKSVDGGGNWTISLSDFYASLVVEGSTAQTIYAAGPGVVMSTDGGATWTAKNNGLLDQNGSPVAIRSLVVDHNNPNIVYALGGVVENYYTVFRSTDAGEVWTTVHTWFLHGSSEAFLRVNALTIDPIDSNVLYAGGATSASGLVFKSTNAGSTWTQSAPLGNDSRSIIGGVAVDPVNPSNVYAATGFEGLGMGVFRSTNAGQSWTLSKVGAQSSAITDFEISSANTNIIYACSWEGVFRSSDAGQTWNLLGGLPTQTPFYAMAIDSNSGGAVYAGSAKGIFKSINAGANWAAANNGLHNVDIWAVTIDPANSNRLFSRSNIFDTNEAYASADGGGSWASSGYFPEAIDPHNSNIIYATVGPNRDLQKSVDGGATWSTANAGLQDATILQVVIDPNHSNVLYAGTYSGVFKSTDAAASWNVLPTQFYPIALVIDPKDSGVLYSFTIYDDCVTVTYPTFKSTDGGVTWTNGPDFFYISSLAIDPVNTTTLYLGGCRSGDCGVFRSDDGGVNWTLAGVPPGEGASCLAVDPLKSGLLYAGTSGAGVFKSADKGKTWTPLNSGLTNLDIHALALDLTGNFLHAATGAGVFDYQIAIPCVYLNSSTSQTFSATGGSGNVNVTAPGGCSWQTANSASWISLDPASGGSGDGTVNFSVATNISVFPRTANVTIAGHQFTVNQFGGAAINSIDGTDFFVRQHYLDFLNRDPDPSGFAFWGDSINSCGFDPQCFEVKRINASGAFFLSIEFQQTGYLVYRTYKAAYGNLPDAPVPISFNEFLGDTQQIGQGVIVNQTDWEQLLENHKQAFFAAFVQRTRFTSEYPFSLMPDQFVDQLFLKAGLTPSATERQAAISEFGAAADTSDISARARVLRRVAENATLLQQEFNRAFVLMQYFGYLRRNPNDSPEPGLNFDGYNFWLSKLNQFHGNFVEAEMVKAFLSSTEYRQRFGQP